MPASDVKPVLFIGYGPVGTHAAKALRQLYPDLPFVIAGRNFAKAAALASDVGNATSLFADITKPGLGLPEGMAFSFIFPMVKDKALHAMRLAQALHLPYAAFSEFVYDFAPFIAQHMRDPSGAALLLLGHLHGGAIPIAALEYAKAFDQIDQITISAIFDPSDFGTGGTASSNMATGNFGVPSYLILEDRKWKWVANGSERLSVKSIDGRDVPAQGFALPDVITLANETNARSVRDIFTLGKTARSARGEGISHEIFIEIEGLRKDGSHGTDRYELEDDAGYAALSARGAVFCIERMLGLVGGGPVKPGIYNPETILDPAHIVERLQQFGTRITKV